MRLVFRAWWALVAGTAGCFSQVPPSVSHQLSASAPVYNRSSSTARVTLASWYGPGFEGRRTSIGEDFDSRRFTAASRALPLGSYVRVTNLDNGQSVVVRVNDRGPYVRGRGIDLSQAAAERLGFRHEGFARVQVTRLDAVASAVAREPVRWTGTGRVRHRYYWSRRRRHSNQPVRNPLSYWLLELVRSTRLS
jgi:rare lipoprotein A